MRGKERWAWMLNAMHRSRAFFEERATETIFPVPLGRDVVMEELKRYDEALNFLRKKARRK